MKSILDFVVREFLYSGHLQSIGAAIIVYVASVMFGFPLSAVLLIGVYLLFQAIYYFDRYRDIDIDTVTNKERAGHLQAYLRHIPIVILILICVAEIVLVRVGATAAAIFAGIIALFGFLYPIFFKRQTIHLPLFKDVYVALVFALLIFFPFIYYNRPIILTTARIAFFLFVFAESVVAQMLLDLKDDVSDKKHGLRTLPTLVGRENAHLYILVSSLVIAVTAIIFSITSSSLPILIPLAVITLLLNLGSLFLVKNHDRQGFVLMAAKYWVWLLVFLIW